MLQQQSKETASEADFFDEQGLLKEYQPKNMNVLSGTSNDKPIMIEFGCGLSPLSIDRKLTLQVDTGADANAINKKTFDQLFPEVELEKSSFILKNFDERLIKPIGSFRCFLRWKGHKYRVQIEVMGADTPNILSRETTFIMGILKKCFVTEKVQDASNSLIPGPTTNERTETSMEGVFCNSAPSMEAVFCHSNPLTEGTSHGRCILPFSTAHGRNVHGRSILQFSSIHRSCILPFKSAHGSIPQFCRLSDDRSAGNTDFTR